MTRFSLAALAGLLLALSLSAADETKVGGEQTLATGPLLAQPRAAFGAGVYLVVWQDGWSGLDATADIKALRLRPGTLQPIDQEPIRICSGPEAQESPAVAQADGVFLVVWQDFRNGKHYDIRGTLVDARTGQLRGSEILIAGRAVTQCRPSVCADGQSFLVVWQELRDRDTHAIRGVRIASSGKVLDDPPLEYAAAGSSPVVAAANGRALVAWTVKQRNQSKTAAALVDLATGQKTKDLGVINTCCGDSVAVAADGRGDFATVAARAGAPDPWGWGGPGAIVLSRALADGATPESKLDYAYRLSNLCSRKVPNVVDAAVWKGAKTWEAGAPGGFPGTEDGLWPTGTPAVVHDGQNSYLFAWVKGRLNSDRLNVSNQDIWLRGMDGKTLAVTQTDRPVAGDPAVDETCPVLVNGPPGEILLVYERLKPGENRQVVARRIALPQSAPGR